MKTKSYTLYIYYVVVVIFEQPLAQQFASGLFKLYLLSYLNAIGHMSFSTTTTGQDSKTRKGFLRTSLSVTKQSP